MRSWQKNGLLGIGFLGIVGMFFFVDPRGSNLYPPCLFRTLTGYYCPGCGSGQAVHLLLRGQVLEAMYYNPFWVVAVGIIAVIAVVQCFLVLKKPPLYLWKNKHFLKWALVVLTLSIFIFWIWRNLSCYPFFPN